MRFLRAAIQAVDDLFVVILTVGALTGFFAGYFWTSDRFGPFWPSVVILASYAGWILYRIFQPRKKVKNREVSDTGTDNRNSGNTGSVVKLDDLTVSQAVREARARSDHGDKP